MGLKPRIGILAFLFVAATVFAVDARGGSYPDHAAGQSQPRLMLACRMGGMGMGGMNMTGTGTSAGSTTGMGMGMGCMGQNMNETDSGKPQGTPPQSGTGAGTQQQGGTAKGMGNMPGMSGTGQAGTVKQ